MMRRHGGQKSKPKSWTIGGFVACCAAGLVVFAVLAVLLLTPMLSELHRQVLSDAARVPAAALVLLSSLRTSRVADRRLRTSWRLMTVTGLLWLLGEASWFIQSYVVMHQGAPSVSDVFYLAALVTAAAALLLFPPPHRGTHGRVVSLLSCLVALGSVLFIGRVLTVRLGAPGGEVATAADLFYAVYPLADVALLALTLVALIRSGNRARTYLWLVAGGLATYAVADTVYSIDFSSPLPPFTTGYAVDLLWLVGYQLIALASVHPSAGTDQPVTDGIRHGGLVSLLVHLPILAAVAVIAGVPGRFDASIVVTGLALLTVFAVRQVLLAADHSALNAQRDQQLAAVRESETRLRQQVLQTSLITQSVADGIVVVDPDRRVLVTNRAAANLLGRPSTELEGRLLDDLLGEPGPHPGGGDPGSAAVITAVIEGTVLSAVDAQFRSGAGSVPVELTVGPVRDHDIDLVEDDDDDLVGDRSAGTVLVLRDMSARRAVDKLQNEFISVVSHELRTPLTSIRGSLALLDGGALGALQPTGARMVKLALQASERLTRLIDDLLDVEQLESGTQSMQFTECDAASLVEAAQRQMRSLAEQHQIELVGLDSVGRVLADPDRIVQTLTNLISNAIKYSPADSRITVQSVMTDPDLVEFSVADQGLGIAPEFLETVFKRFEQVDSSDSRQRGGTGLGLAICRNIVTQHGGRIWVTSEPHHGSTFRFVLPAAPSRPPAPPDPSDPPTRDQPTRDHPVGERPAVDPSAVEPESSTDRPVTPQPTYAVLTGPGVRSHAGRWSTNVPDGRGPARPGGDRQTADERSAVYPTERAGMTRW